MKQTRWARLGGLGVWLGSLLAIWAQDPGGEALEPPASAELSRGPYLQLSTPESVVVVWRTLGEMTQPTVRFGEAPDRLPRSVSQGVVRQAQDAEEEEEAEAEGDALSLSGAPPFTVQYEWLLEGLEPGRTYFYAVDDGERRLAGGDASHFLRPAPPSSSASPMRFWVVGDSGNGSPLQRAVFTAAQAFVEASGRPIDAYLHLGDMAYTNGGDAEFSANFFAIYASLLRNTVTWPTMGNHEGSSSSGVLGRGPYYDAYVTPTRGEAGGVASGNESYYAFDYGPIHFVSLNSHDVSRSPEGEMAQWLREDLSRVTAPWLVAFFHHPPYSKGTHDSDLEWRLVEMREHIMPILESHGVDLVLAGHSHTYERSMLIDGAYATPTVVEGVVLDDGDGNPHGDGAYRKSENLHPHEGTVAVVAGHGRGAAQHYGYMPVMRSTVPEAGSFFLDWDGDRLTGTMINHLGQRRDSFQLIKSGRQPAREPLTHPWRPAGPRATVVWLGEGQVKVVLTPDPPAPDAVIRYTLDGSPITEASPRYTEPLIFSQDVFLSARSEWREGTRKSLVTRTGWVRPGPLQGMRIPVISAQDDTRGIEPDLEWADPELALDSQGFYVRFRDLRVPPEVTISRAYVQFTAAATQEGPGKAHLVLASGHGFSLESDLESDGEIIPWEPGTWFAGARSRSQRTPDLSGPLQRMMGEGRWEEPRDLVVRLGGESAHRVVSFDGDPGAAALLVIDYEPQAPLEAAASQAPFVAVGRRDGEPVYRVLTRQLTGPAAEGLRYVFEGSTSLHPDDWRPLEDEAGWVPLELPMFEGAWQFLGFERQGALTEERFFTRFRVHALAAP